MTREGRRLQLVEVEVRAGDATVCRARVLRQRLAEVTVPALDPPVPPPRSPSEVPDRPPPAKVQGQIAFHSDAVEHRFVQGSFETLGPSIDWIRLLVDVIEGEPPSPTQRALAAADFANGVSRVLDFESHLFLNPELTVHLVRPPEGEWTCLRCRTDLGTVGAGLSSSWLFDEAGWLGASHQSLYVDER